MCALLHLSLMEPLPRADMLCQPGTAAAVRARSLCPTSSRCSRDLGRGLTPLRPQQAIIRQTYCHATSKVCNTCPCCTTHTSNFSLCLGSFEEECRTRKAKSETPNLTLRQEHYRTQSSEHSITHANLNLQDATKLPRWQVPWGPG